MKTDLQQIPWPELTTILLARLGVLWVLVLAALLLPGDETALYALMGVAFIITIPYSLWLRNKVKTLQFAPLQFLADLILVTGVVYFTGGLYSNLTLLYPLVILCAGIVSTPRQAAQTTLLGMLIYTLMVMLIRNGVLVAYLPADQALHLDRSNVTMALRLMIFLCFGAVSIYISKRCAYIHRHAGEAAEMVTTMLQGMPAPTLMLDRDGRIIDANPAAAELLHMDTEDLLDIRFTDLCASDKKPVPEQRGPSSYLKVAGHAPLPVALKSQTIRIPAAPSPDGWNGKEQTIPVTLLSLTDLSDLLNTEQQLEQTKHVCAATRIAGELAHEIRTPLTTLSASIQLLQHLESKATAADWLPGSPRKSERMELFGHIEEASQQMDSVVQNFVDFAEYSPDDLLSIIKLDSGAHNQGYIGHLNTIGRGLKDGQDSDSG